MGGLIGVRTEGVTNMGAPLGYRVFYHEFSSDLNGEKTKTTVMESWLIINISNNSRQVYSMYIHGEKPDIPEQEDYLFRKKIMLR